MNLRILNLRSLECENFVYCIVLLPQIHLVSKVAYICASFFKVLSVPSYFPLSSFLLYIMTTLVL